MSNKHPLVSVCIPSYNHEKYVTDCIKSIIAQTYDNIELIVIDDGSKDSTFTKIKKMESVCKKRFVNVVFKTKENEGTCKTVNKLNSIANGKYIYSIASDDMAKPEAIKTFVNFLESNPEYALVVGDDEIIDGDGKRAFWDAERNNVYDRKTAVYKTFGEFLKKQNRKIDFNSDEFGKYRTLFGNNYIPNGYLIRRDILEKTGQFTPDAPLEDWWLMLQISKYAKLKYIDKILFSYRWHGANTITNISRIKTMASKTAQYEWNYLKHSDFSGMMSDVKKTYFRELRRRFIHRFIYHKYRIDGNRVIKLFGIIKIKSIKK